MSEQPTRLYFHVEEETERPARSVATSKEFQTFLSAFASGNVAMRSKHPVVASRGGGYHEAHVWLWVGPGSAPHTPEKKGMVWLLIPLLSLSVVLCL